MDQWTLGWDALAGIGTLLLAGATAWLGWGTRAMAKAAREDLAGLSRPVLVFRQGTLSRDSSGKLLLRISVRNDGTGPALDVNWRLSPQEPAVRTDTGLTVIPLWAATPLVASGEEEQLATFAPEGGGFEKRLMIDFGDVFGRPYGTVMELHVVGHERRLPGRQVQRVRGQAPQAALLHEPAVLVGRQASRLPRESTRGRLAPTDTPRFESACRELAGALSNPDLADWLTRPGRGGR